VTPPPRLPRPSVAIYNGDPDDGGTLVEEITNATLSDMGGGDVYSYTTISKRYFMMKKSDSDIRIMVYKA
jgi:hypothetical protein